MKTNNFIVNKSRLPKSVAQESIGKHLGERDSFTAIPSIAISGQERRDRLTVAHPAVFGHGCIRIFI
ncbi:hypothetical protein QUF80_14035 [Desulfococcaceae bacterium HSG8]|nr:hypothetical protein [Desulfococcaceae bacterium HSG8]